MSSPIDPPEPAQARRRALSRSTSDRVLALAEHLAPGDRELVEQVYRHGQALARVARATGTSPHRLNRRLSRILQRMRDPRFHFVLARGALMPREVQAVARRVVVEGRSLRATARLTGLSLHRVRQHMATVRTCHRLAEQGAPALSQAGAGAFKNH